MPSVSSRISRATFSTDRVDPEAAATARARYGRLAPWSDAPQGYGRRAKRQGHATCVEPVVATLRDLNARALGEAARADPDAFLDAALSILLVEDAEACDRAMVHSSAESWNLRDRHMATRWSGCSTHAGRVAAADDRVAPMRVMDVNPSRSDSVERLCHDAGLSRGLLGLRAAPEDLRAALAKPRLQRLIGVIQRPDTERWSYGVECAVAEQYEPGPSLTAPGLSRRCRRRAARGLPVGALTARQGCRFRLSGSQALPIAELGLRDTPGIRSVGVRQRLHTRL